MSVQQTRTVKVKKERLRDGKERRREGRKENGRTEVEK